jgi:CubicO group peptidase (beta-lactamase class C family)
VILIVHSIAGGDRTAAPGLAARVACLFALLLLPACGPTADGPAVDGEAGRGCPFPAPAGLAPAPVATVLREASALQGLTSLLVWKEGVLMAEGYWRGGRPDRDVNIKSASKSVLSALVGIALERGELEGLDQPVAELLPGYFGPGTDSLKREITLRHLLTMSSGLESTSHGNYGWWVAGRDWTGRALSMPLEDPPGTRMDYSTGDSHLVSAILTRATGTSTRAYAQRHLFDPLGVEIGSWQRSPRGIYFGGNNMSLSPRDLLAFGRLYMEDGVHEGRRILPADWVAESLASHAVNPRYGQSYGYFWWIREIAGRRVPHAWGYGGQYVFLVPSLDLMVVTTSVSSPEERSGFSHNRRIFGLLEELIRAAEEGERCRPGTAPGRIAAEDAGIAEAGPRSSDR